VAKSPDAVDLALRALRFRDRSAAELDARLSKLGVEADERNAALETLARSGYLDDERLAHARAASLADRGSGDALIKADLEGRGIPDELVVQAIAALEPERERVAQVVARRGDGQKTLRYLAARGFGEDALDAVVARDVESAIG
jgi:regulatory protein